jgi:hypothetical protein
MVAKATRMAVNAAIEKLIARSEDSEAAARTVIEYGDGMRIAGPVQAEATITTKRHRGSISGYSPGHGNVTIKNDEESKDQEFTFGVYKDRVGYYRIWKQAQGLLCFHRFWKSGLVTRGPEEKGPDVYRLAYSPKSLQPKYLAIVRSKIILNLGLIKFRFYYQEPLIGIIRKKRYSFGISIG